MSYKRLFEECVGSMIVSNATQLKENLIEIIDHDVKIIKFMIKYDKKWNL